MGDASQARWFCPLCFADDRGGSWGEGVIDGAHCANCGASGSAIQVPQWAVDSIRQQASWVGKRYYPHEEDRTRNAEVCALRKRLPIPTDRTAEPIDDEPGLWYVKQPTGAGSYTATSIRADSADAALAASHERLPFPPENDDA